MEALVQWSKTKQAELESQLTGFWAEDAWQISQCPLIPTDFRFPPKVDPARTIYLQCSSPSLKIEIKYALRQKLEQGFSVITLWTRAATIHYLMEWLSRVAPYVSSLLERSLARWELSLRSYLAERGKLREALTPPRLNQNQQLRQYNLHSVHITTFRQIYKVVESAYDDRPEYEKEVWDLRKLGVLIDPTKSNYKLTLTKITQPWLLQAVKQFSRYSLSVCSPGECQNRVAALNDFSVFLAHHYPSVCPSEINRALLLEYLSDLPLTGLSEGTRHRQIGHLRAFLELCAREGWADVPDKRLIYNEDFPRLSKPLPRFIPQDVMEQLNQHLDALPAPIMRMVLIIQECGMRISELCRLHFNCLTQDACGDWFFRYYQFKLKKEHSIPISKEVAAVIQEQQAVVTEQWGQDFPYLFPNKKGSPLKQKVFTDALNRLAYDKEIRDSSGCLWRFQSHQFRHTVGTRMINLGVPHHIVQRYLGHESPEMTNRYAYIYDQTLKEAFAKFKGKLVDVTGRVVEPETVASDIAEGSDLNDVDAQWLKRNILAQALPNGLCTLPVIKGPCPYGANKCLSCTHFKTDIRYLDQHQEHLSRTKKLVEWAQETPASRRAEEILKENLPIQDNLERIITSLQGNPNETPA